LKTPLKRFLTSTMVRQGIKLIGRGKLISKIENGTNEPEILPLKILPLEVGLTGRIKAKGMVPAI
jgi:hypothetical protein